MSGCGRVAQSAVRFIRNEEVVGSIPISTSTRKEMDLPKKGKSIFFYKCIIITYNQLAKLANNQMETVVAQGLDVSALAYLIRNQIVSKSNLNQMEILGAQRSKVLFFS